MAMPLPDTTSLYNDIGDRLMRWAESGSALKPDSPPSGV
jgi:hypothetical protein